MLSVSERYVSIYVRRRAKRANLSIISVLRSFHVPTGTAAGGRARMWRGDWPEHRRRDALLERGCCSFQFRHLNAQLGEQG